MEVSGGGLSFLFFSYVQIRSVIEEKSYLLLSETLLSQTPFAFFFLGTPSLGQFICYCVPMPKKGRKKAVKKSPLRTKVDENVAPIENGVMQFKERQRAFNKREGTDSYLWLFL